MLDTIQRESVISFPMLGGLTLNPPAYFTVFGRPIYFYGVLIGCGFLLGILLCAKRAPRFGLALWSRPDPCAQLPFFARHCEERSDAAIRIPPVRSFSAACGLQRAAVLL